MEDYFGNNSPKSINERRSEDIAELQDFANLSEVSASQAKASTKNKFRSMLKPVDFEKDSKVRWNAEENFFLIKFYIVYGANWGVISEFFADRSESSVKNHFYNLKKQLSQTERIRINKERKAYNERKIRSMPREPTLNFIAKDYEDDVVESFFADYLNTAKSQNLNEKCMECKFYENNMDTHESDEREKSIHWRINMLKKFCKFIERQLDLIKEKVVEILI